MTPNDRRYAKTHEWLKLEGDTAVVGITDHAQHALGDITFFDPPRVGAKVAAGGTCGAIESVKAANDIYAPAAGEVAAVNAALAEAPETVNQDPYGAGWMFKLRGVQAAALAGLLDAKAYDAQVESEK
jgi:glycine cleavage system H protein